MGLCHMAVSLFLFPTPVHSLYKKKSTEDRSSRRINSNNKRLEEMRWGGEGRGGQEDPGGGDLGAESGRGVAADMAGPQRAHL